MMQPAYTMHFKRRTLNASCPGKDAAENAEPYFVSGSEDLPPDRGGVSLENTFSFMAIPGLPSDTWRPGEASSIRGCARKFTSFAMQNPLKTILVSMRHCAAEGETFVAANLAVSLARNRNKHCLLIDA